MSILNMDVFDKKRFRDPIYGYISLSDAELKIVDTPVFQRLRRIHQLALTKYVYHGAEHSRFVHSLGVMQCATEVFLSLKQNYKKNKKADLEEVFSENNFYKNLKILRFACLLHDVGHTPFSHATEKVFLGDKLSHEDITCHIIINDIAISDAIRSADIDPYDVASVVSKNTIGILF